MLLFGAGHCKALTNKQTNKVARVLAINKLVVQIKASAIYFYSQSTYNEPCYLIILYAG